MAFPEEETVLCARYWRSLEEWRSDTAWILSDVCYQKAVKCELKGIVVKDMVGNRGKIGSEGIWKYRALKNGNFLFKHEYIFVFKKK